MIKIVDWQVFANNMLMTCDLVMGYSNIQQKIIDPVHEISNNVAF